MAGKRALLTVVLTDAVGFSTRAGHDEEAALDALNADFSIIRSAVEAHEGKVIKTTGDGLLITFDIPGQAVDCCLQVQTQFATRGEEFYQHRIGIHLCEVVVEENDIHGDGVNLAARLEAQATPGTIAISQTVYDIVKSRLGVEPKPLGEKLFKNIPAPVNVFELSPSNSPKRKVSSIDPTPRRNFGFAAAVTAIVASIAALGAIIWVKVGGPRESDGPIIIERIGQTSKGSEKPNAGDSGKVKPTVKTVYVAAKPPKPTGALTNSQPATPPSSAPGPTTATSPLPSGTPVAAPPSVNSSGKSSENPFDSGPAPLPKTVIRQRVQLLRTYDFDGLLALFDASPELKAMPSYPIQLDGMKKLRDLKVLIKRAILGASSDNPLKLDYKSAGSTSAVSIEAWGASGETVKFRLPTGEVDTKSLGELDTPLFRALAVASIHATSNMSKSRSMLVAFDLVYGGFGGRRASKNATVINKPDASSGIEF